MAEKSSDIKVSVIIPVYNVEAYLNNAIDSVLNQTLKEIEIICINDSSPDTSIEILKEYSKKDSRIKIIDLEENKGQGNARNIAIQEAKGEYIMFLDPDDWFKLDACEKAYNQITKNNNDFVIFDFVVFYEKTAETKLNSKYSDAFKHLENKTTIVPKKCDFQFFFNAFCMNKIYKTSFLKENNIFFSIHRFSEDLPFSIKVFSNAESFSFIPEALYFYRKKASGNMTLNYTEYYSHVVDSHKENYLYIQNIGNENLIRNYLVYTLKSTFLWFDTFTFINESIKKDFYNKLHNYYLLLNESPFIDSIYNETNYKRFKKFLKYKTYNCFNIFSFIEEKILKNIFHIKNSVGCKKLTILGLKFKIKK